MRNAHTLYYLKYGKMTDQQGKSENHLLRHGICRETVKNVKNGKCTLQDVEYVKQPDKLRN